MRALKKFFITMVVGLLLTGWIAVSRGLMEQVEPVKIYHILCDSFFAVGILVSSVGSLIFVSNEGAFDPLIYGVRSFINIFRKRNKRKMETYYDFRMARAEHKFPFLFILLCGMILLAVSVVMYILYRKYNVESINYICNWMAVM